MKNLNTILPRKKFSESHLHDSVLRHITPAPPTLSQHWTVEEAINELRRRQLAEGVFYFYVTDAQGALAGVVPTRRLLTSPPDALLSSLMLTEIISVPSTATVIEACELFAEHRLLAFPVVDSGNRILGIIDVNVFTDEAITSVEIRDAERAFQLIGVHLSLGRRVSAMRSFLDRVPWLLCNITGGLICAVVASFYEPLLNAVVVLALFIPLVLALAESVSMQSMTLTLSNMAHGRVRWRRLMRNLRHEFFSAILLGSCCGVSVGVLAWAWKSSAAVGAAIGLSIALSIVSACLLGVLIPTMVRSLRKDPRIAAGPMVLALADVATLLFYFQIAGWLLQ